MTKRHTGLRRLGSPEPRPPRSVNAFGQNHSGSDANSLKRWRDKETEPASMDLVDAHSARY